MERLLYRVDDESLLLFMALGTAGSYCKSSFAIVARTAGLALLHLFHGGTLGITVREYLGVAVIASVGCCVEIVAEIANYGAPAVLEGEVCRLVAYMALITVSAGCKGVFPIMTNAAGLAFLHLGHGDLT